MPRYFIELAYRGTHFSGFQIQQNASSVQQEVQRALKIYFRQEIELTCSSRTDAGVHAYSNYFHFEAESMPEPDVLTRSVYHLNAILHEDIVIKRMYPVPPDFHARFDATSRHYRYELYQQKNPFLKDRAYYYPYQMDIPLMQSAAELLMEYQDFTSFSKRNTQVKTFNCRIMKSTWLQHEAGMCYEVKADRFLRGMVRGLVGTMLRVGTGKLSIDQFREVILAKDCTKVDFAVPAHGLFLLEVAFPDV